MSDVVGKATYLLEADARKAKATVADLEKGIKASGATAEKAFSKQTTGALDKLNASMQRMTKAQGLPGAILGGFGIGAGIGVFGLVKDAVGAVAGAIGDTIDAAKQFDDQLRTINTVAGVSDAQLGRIGDRIQELSRETGKTTDELAAGFYDLVSAGIPAENAMQVLKDSAILATGALGTTGETVDLLTSALNAYGMKATESTRLTDIFAAAVRDGKVTAGELGQSIAQIAPIAAAAGVSIEEVAAGYAQLTKNGVPAAEAATQMRQAISALITPNLTLAGIQKQVNVNFAELARSDGLGVALQTLRDAAGSNEVFAKALGNVQGLGFALLTTGENAAGFATELGAVKKAADEGGVALGQYTEKSKSQAEQDKRLAAQTKTLMQDIGGLIQPIYAALIGGATLVIQTIRDLGAAFHDFQRFLDRNLAAAEDQDKALIILAQRYGISEDALLSYAAANREAATANADLDAWIHTLQDTLSSMDDVPKNTLIAGLNADLQKLADAAGVPLATVLADAKTSLENFDLAADGTSGLLTQLAYDFGVSKLAAGDFTGPVEAARATLLAFLLQTKNVAPSLRNLGSDVAKAWVGAKTSVDDLTTSLESQYQAALKAGGSAMDLGQKWDAATALVKAYPEEVIAQWKSLDGVLKDAAIGAGIVTESMARELSRVGSAFHYLARSASDLPRAFDVSFGALAGIVKGSLRAARHEADKGMAAVQWSLTHPKAGEHMEDFLRGEIRKGTKAMNRALDDRNASGYAQAKKYVDTQKAKLHELEMEDFTIKVKMDFITKMGGIPGLGSYASGGYAPAGKVAIVGERGPELVRFGAAANVSTASETAKALGSSRQDVYHHMTLDTARNLRAVGFDERRVAGFMIASPEQSYRRFQD